MNKINLFYIIILTIICSNVFAQKQKNNPFQMVEVPDSIYYILEEAYKKYTGFDSVNAGRNVWNLLDRKNFVFKNGLYSFKGQGPHFPRLIFIYNNGKTYTFSSSCITVILPEYLQCIELLKLSEEDRIKYLKAISSYLEEELGRTYGVEIKE